jgi:hypothetical protein
MPKSDKWITAEEHIRLLESDPEFMRRRAEQNRLMAERGAQLRREQAPILADLDRLGFKIDALSQLMSRYPKYPEAIPVLLEHLQKPYPDAVHAWIARALAVRATRKVGWRTLVQEYAKTDIASKEAKDAIALALAAACDRSVLPELIELARDKSHGSSRILLLSAIKRSKQPEARKVITELAKDAQLEKEINSWPQSRKGYYFTWSEDGAGA